jgi:type IV pilus assembly protein PilY1
MPDRNARRPRAGGPAARPRATAFAAAAAAALWLAAHGAALAATSPDKLNYRASPVMSAGKTVPRVLLVLSKDHKLFQQAYNELTDVDGDGRIDTGFNPSAQYYGYFDSFSCYRYVGTPVNAANSAGYFQRAGATKDDQSQNALDSARPTAVRDANIAAARAAHYKTGEKIGICNDSHATEGGTFSGNWLNYVTATRMDVVRKILYGGFRLTDTNVASNGAAGRTVLQSSQVPRDAHVWGTDVVSDSRWASETAMTKYYDISKYTPYPKPASGTAHFFARTRNNTSAAAFPVVEYILNAGTSHFKDNINRTGVGGRYFDWVYNDAPNPSSANLANPGGVIKTFTVHVEVCAKGNTGEGEGCRAYPNGNLKPAGLLQQNGENAQMLFGLLTGSFSHSAEATAETTLGANTRRKGGVVRNHIDDLSKSIDLDTGLFTAGGLIRNIDSLTIAGNPTPTATGYGSAISWGNPVGEMLYEAVRFLARHAEGAGGTTQPTAAFLPTAESTYNSSNQAPYLKTWATLTAVPAADCAKPVILLIAEADSDYDGDTAVNTAGGINRPLLGTLPSSLSTALPSSFDMATYLDKITANERLATSASNRNYFYANGPLSDCMPKALTSLSQVKGLCPTLPSYEGTYSSAAVAYYGHTHNFGVPGSSEQSLDIYAVTMTGAFPPLEFPVYNSNGTVNKKITIIPGAMSSRDGATTVGRILGMLNYFILDWQTDSRGTPYHVKLKVNFEDAAQAQDKGYGSSDWDSDLLVEYTVDLVSSSKLAKSGTESFASTNARVAGALKVKTGTYWSFKTPYDRSFTVEPSDVAGLVVATWKSMNSAGVRMMGGYTVSGSTRDGTYMDVGHNGGEPYYATPPTCNWPSGYGGATSNNGTGCKVAFGNSPGMSKGDAANLKMWRTFEFSSNAAAAGEYLPGPLWLAAKYGGFNDFNRNGVPDAGEFEGPDGVTPRNFFQATNIAELPLQLETAFRDIARSISTGTATSSSVDTILGGGVSVQTVYYPLYQNPENSNQPPISWVGSVYGLFVDKYGNFREDSDRDGMLTVANGQSGGTGDYILTFNSQSIEPEVKPGCYEFGDFISRCYDPIGTNNPSLFGDGRRHPKTLQSIAPLFDTGKWLMRLPSAKLATGTRPVNTVAAITDGRRRILYGKPATLTRPSPEMGLFNTSSESLAELTGLMLHDNWQDSLPGVADKATAARHLVEWITGIEKSAMDWRSRTVGDPWGNNVDPGVWRLGDVINSKPILVGAPQSNFDILYGDRSYTRFKSDNSNRRQMAYFGANDGMLHAINVGFYGSLRNGQVEFQEDDGVRKAHERGAEVWAYIPTSVLPHLRWLPDPQYSHAYYVDLKPLVNDVKIDGEWRTVLLGGLRLGGRPIETPDPAKAGAEHYYSEIFALDITDPESDPKLLWRYSSLQMGLTVGLPSIISHDGKWYAVIPTGPVTDTPVAASAPVKAYVQFGADSPYEAYSNQKARLIILDAENGVPDSANDTAGYLTVPEDNSFFNNPFLPVAQKRVTPWSNHALYYGLTVSQEHDTCIDSGAVYRLQTVNPDGTPLPVAGWKIKKLFDTDAPVTGAVNATYDSSKNLWVLFGTGRLWNVKDDVPPCTRANTAACKANHRHYIYGIKEELNIDGYMTFSDRTPEKSKLLDFSNAAVYSGGVVTGLSAQAGLTLTSGGTSGYNQLEAATRSPGSIGYRRALDLGKIAYPTLDNFELIVTQPKLVPLGNGRSLLAFTSFSPREAGCGDFGDGYLYLVDTFTGLPDPGTRQLFTDDAPPDSSTAPQGARVTGGLTTGKGTPTEAFVISSSAGTTVSASAPDASTTSIFIPSDAAGMNRLTAWREVFDSVFALTKEIMSDGL